MNARSSILAASAGLLLLGPAAQNVAAQRDRDVYYGTRTRPLEGRRFETMRALAHYLDQSAQEALRQATEDSRRGAQGRRILPLVRDFARRADAFHTMMDNYETRRRDVPPQVNDLIMRARTVNSRLGTTYVAGTTRLEWTHVIDVLDRMKRLTAGEDVQVPQARRGFEDYDRDYGMFGDVRRESDDDSMRFGWQGARRSEFRRLAQELADNALRAHQIAENNRATSVRHQEFLSELRRFAERTHAVRTQADNNQVNRREMVPIVNQLLQDARSTDRSLRDTRVFPQVLDQWSRTIDVLNRMVEAVRD
jgi:hypothetical protein